MNKLLLYLYFVITPLYFFGSGLPQISEWIMTLLFLLNIISILNIIFKKFSLTYSLLFIYIFLVNIFYFYYTQQTGFLVTGLYYIFNWLVIGLILYLVITEEKKYLKIILYGCITSGILQVFLSVIVPSDSTRNTILFNNPNQLAEYALMIAVIGLYCNSRLKGRIIVSYTIMGIGLYLSYLSASKAGIVSLLVLAIIFLIINSKSLIEKLSALLVSVLLLITTYLVFTDSKYLYGINNQIDLILRRFNHNSNHDTGIFLERGYNRIIEFPQYIIFGAGEGYLERFNTNIELHSLFGTLLFSYGLIGLILFLILITYLIFNLKFTTYYILIGPFLYSITHQGLRETFLWILIALFINEIWKEHERRKYLKVKENELKI